MQWIRKALVAVNDSKAALHAFTEALRLSLTYGFRLDAVCVGPPYQGDLALVGVRDLKRTRTEPCRTVLDEAVSMAEEAGAGLTTFAAEGNRLDAILQIAAKGACDLIIMGQEPGFPWTALGSLTAGLLCRSPVDVLVIPRDQPVGFDRVVRARGRSLLKQAGPVDADLVVWEHDGHPERWWTAIVGTALYRAVSRSRQPVWVEKAIRS
jgi:nucleotide-binding universal stress UspA family protein